MTQEPAHHTLIKHFESCKLKPYLCSAGVPTIGWGSTYYPDGRKVTMQDPAITQLAADALFLVTVAEYERGVSKMLARVAKSNVHGAFASFSFNVGLDDDADTLAEGFGDSSMLRIFNAGAPLMEVATKMLAWNKVKGVPSWGVMRRRLAEAHLLLTGNLKLDWDRKEHGF